MLHKKIFHLFFLLYFGLRGVGMLRLVLVPFVSLFLVVAGVVAQQPLRNADIVKMVKAGISDDLIVATIRNASAKDFDLSPDTVIKLKASGVSEAVIAAMLGAGAGPEKSDAAQEVVIPDGTEVHLKLLERLSSATAKVNDRVRLEATEDVVVGDKVVIAKGAKATGTVTAASPKKSFGRSGKLNFTIDVVKAVDGSNVRLRATKENKGNESYGKAGVVTILAGPFGALVKGKDVEIEAGTEYVIYIDGDRTIRLRTSDSSR